MEMGACECACRMLRGMASVFILAKQTKKRREKLNDSNKYFMHYELPSTTNSNSTNTLLSIKRISSLVRAENGRRTSAAGTAKRRRTEDGKNDESNKFCVVSGVVNDDSR